MHMRAIRQDLFHGQAICIKERDRYVATTQEILNGLASLQESHPTHKLDFKPQSNAFLASLYIPVQSSPWSERIDASNKWAMDDEIQSRS